MLHVLHCHGHSCDKRINRSTNHVKLLTRLCFQVDPSTRTSSLFGRRSLEPYYPNARAFVRRFGVFIRYIGVREKPRMSAFSTGGTLQTPPTCFIGTPANLSPGVCFLIGVANEHQRDWTREGINSLLPRPSRLSPPDRHQLLELPHTAHVRTTPLPNAAQY